MIPPTDAVLNRLSQEFPYADLSAATGGFSSSARLGEGTYGTVFSGVLRDGTEVAIKALASPKEGGFREEVEVLSRFRHPNLVILMGFARNGRERYLVYELLPGGDVNSRLNRDLAFTWRQRLNVILDAALGLSHLHGSRPQVFHRDVKTQNILMDRNGTGKVADFGLACLAQPNQDRLAVSQTSGTIGYADPLYIRTGVVTEKSEVYSLGMVLLEVLTGRPPALQHPNGRIEYQFDHINGDLKRLYPMVDRRGKWPEALAQRVGGLALQCTCEHEACRPSFVDIVKQLRAWLRDEQFQFPEPQRPLGPAEGSPPRQAGREVGREVGRESPQFAAMGAAGGGVHARPAPEAAAARAYAGQPPVGQAPPWPEGASGASARPLSPRRPSRPSNPFADVAPAGGAGAAAFAERRPSGPAPAPAAAAGVAGERFAAREVGRQPVVAAPARREGAPLGAGQGAAQGRPAEHSGVAAASPAELGPQRPRTSPGQEEVVLQLLEMGYTQRQAQEACKRCSTVEAAVEWISTSQ